MKTPSIFQYAKALMLMLVLAITISFAFNIDCIQTTDFIPFYHAVAGVFMSLFAINMILGFALKKAGLVPKGVLKNDSLIINDTSFAGTVAPIFILPAMYSFDSVTKGALYVRDNIRKKYTIPTMDFSGPLQQRVATPTQSGGNLTIGARTLEPADVMAYQEMNPRNFEVHWDSENLSQTLLSRQLPQTAENYIMLLLLGRSFEQFENMVWMGSTQYQNNPNVPQLDINGSPNPFFQVQFIDGFIKRMLADSATYKIANPQIITAANVGSVLLALYNSVVTNNKGLISADPKRTKMKYYCSYLTKALYEQYLTTQPFKGNDPTARGIDRFLDWQVVPLAGIPDNTVVFTNADPTPEGNLWLGMNSVSDENFQLMKLYPNSEIFFFKMLMKLDVNYGRSEKVFLYTTLVSADFVK